MLGIALFAIAGAVLGYFIADPGEKLTGTSFVGIVGLVVGGMLIFFLSALLFADSTETHTRMTGQHKLVAFPDSAIIPGCEPPERCFLLKGSLSETFTEDPLYVFCRELYDENDDRCRYDSAPVDSAHLHEITDANTGAPRIETYVEIRTTTHELAGPNWLKPFLVEPSPATTSRVRVFYRVYVPKGTIVNDFRADLE